MLIRRNRKKAWQPAMRKRVNEPVNKMELTEKEQKLLELIRSTGDGILKIDVESGEPVRVEQILEGCPLD